MRLYDSFVSAILAGSRAISRLVALSLLWTLFSLPIATVGAATITLLQFSADDRQLSVTEFARGVWVSFRRGLWLMAIALGFVAAVALEGIALRFVPEELRAGWGGIVLALAAVALACGVGLPWVLNTHPAGIAALKESVVMAISHPVRTLVVLVTVIAVVQATAVVPLVLPFAGVALVAAVHVRCFAPLASPIASSTD